MADTFDPMTMTWVLSPRDFQWMLEAIKDYGQVITVDLETTGLDEHAVRGGRSNGGYPARIPLMSVTLEDERTWVVPLSHPESPLRGEWRALLTQFAQTLMDHSIPVQNQNMKFDARWIHAHTGVDLSHLIVWDTQISSHLLDENSSTSLKERAPDTFDVERWDDFDLTYPGAADEVPMFDLGAYAARDTYWTKRLADLHREIMFIEGDDEPVGPEEVQDARLGTLMRYVGLPTTKTLTAMEQRGIRVDRNWIVDHLGTGREEMADLAQDLIFAYPGIEGTPSFAPTSRWFTEWADRAVDAGDLTVAALTPRGRPQWSKAVLMRQARAGSEVAQTLLDYRERDKRCQFLSGWLDKITTAGRIHTTYHAGRVVTGRLSSSDPNLQQVNYTLKPAFIPSDGYAFAELDFSQIELRIAAHISRCEPMIEAFQRGEDLHRLLAARITGKPQEEVLAGERQAGKSANFGLLYGMGVGGFQEYAEVQYGVDLTLEEAETIRNTFFSTWDGISQWHADTVRQALRNGEVTSPLGRVRRVPDIWDGNDYRSSAAEREAINSPVQGMASDLMQMAGASIEGYLPGHRKVEGARLIGTVHDSILVEVPLDRWSEVVEECRDRMENGILTTLRKRFSVNLAVPLVADAKVGTRWGLSDIGGDE